MASSRRATSIHRWLANKRKDAVKYFVVSSAKRTSRYFADFAFVENVVRSRITKISIIHRRITSSPKSSAF